MRVHALGALAIVAMPVIAGAQTVEWIRQFGGAAHDRASAIAVAPSGIYVAGATEGALAGQPSAGAIDAFVRKYSPDGAEAWTHQFGGAGIDEVLAMAVDASGVYVAGNTQGPLSGQSAVPGAAHAFVRKYDLNGTEVWTREFGTGRREEVLSLAVHAGAVYGAGDTTVTAPPYNDGFVAQIVPGGRLGWSRWIGTDSTDRASAITVTASGVYVAGATQGTLPGQTSTGDSDAFLRKYGLDGAELWTRQFGTRGGDEILAMTADASGLYLAGITSAVMTGTSSAGEVDAFLSRYDFNGEPVWTRQFGSPDYDDALAIAVSARGVYVAGNTLGGLPGRARAGASDAFVRHYDLMGGDGWTYQFGTSAHDEVLGLSVDASGVYAAGVTERALPGQTGRGSFDAFVIKLSP